MGKWLNLIPVHGPVPEWVPKLEKVRDLANAVKQRTGFETWVDTRSGGLVFGYLGPDGAERAVWDMPLFHDVERVSPVLVGWGDWSADSVCRTLNLVKVDPSIKWKWADDWKAREDTAAERERLEQEEEFGKMCAQDLRDRKRHAVSANFGGDA